MREATKESVTVEVKVGEATTYRGYLPQILEDIKALVDSQTQTDPSFKSTRLYTRLSAAEVRRQLIEKKGYIDDQLPTWKPFV